MGRVLMWIAAVCAAVLFIRYEFLTSKTFEPFVEACSRSENSTPERCECLSRYVHKHFSDNEVEQIMRQQAEGAFAIKVEEVIQQGSMACAAEES